VSASKVARAAGTGAPSRASTLVNYVGLDEGLIADELAPKLKGFRGKPISPLPVPRFL
jgi:hypothetical protein